ncbi:MAG: hypothetical protein JWO59_2018 [Chloroflexi bacterium]|jgi:hypothetical protein|nr:hypothetical protein [Chloroflexota bacterium]MDB5074176.1 hypothetical protein [Chloroflexota bacterium]
MSEVERTIESLLSRVAALESENQRLRQAPSAEPPIGDRSVPRRTLLAAGAGLLGVVAGGELIAHGQIAHAATVSEIADAGHLLAGGRSAVTSAQYAQPRMLGIRVQLAGRRSSTIQWARYEWSLAGHFSDARPPIVVASVIDQMPNDKPDDVCTCSVFTYGKPGAYAAVITVHNLPSHVDHVEVNILAFGG